MGNNNVDVRDFRRALGKFPTGVTIITTTDGEGKPVGVTASSFNTVSIDPPLILWSIDKNSFSTSIFTEAEYFAVNVLANTQVHMSNRFAGRGADKFNGIEHKSDANGSPLFDECAAQFECKTWNVYEGGDHYIIVGEVLSYRHFEENSPLVFSGGSYAVAMQHPSTITNGNLKVPGNGFLGDYLLYLLRIAYTQCSSQLYPELLASYGLTPEEWRVLTLLGDDIAVEMKDLANTVGQPMDLFILTLERMEEKGYVTTDKEEQAKLTEKGTAMAQQAFELARVQEKSILNNLTEQEGLNLKTGLKKIINTMA